MANKSGEEVGTESGMMDDTREPTEGTPLLAEDAAAPVVEPGLSAATTLYGSTADEDNGAAGAAPTAVEDDRPLPVGQIVLLCVARIVEPVAFFSIFPYINQMARDNGQLDYADVGLYSGLIESLFSLTQMAVMLLWGKAADRLGRKPVLVFSMLGVTAATSIFGLATTIWQMILFRCIAGAFAGSIVTIRTMIAEHSTPRTQARAFSWFAFTSNLGIFLGPLIGGALAEPAKQYPGLFGGIRFFEDHPYALPSFAVALLGAIATLLSALFITETLKKEEPAAPENGSGGEAGPQQATSVSRRNKPSSTWQLLKSPGVAIILYMYSHLMVLAFGYTAIAPVFWFTPVPLGGLGFTPLQISLFLALTGAAQAVWLLLVFPPLQQRIGTNGVLRACGAAYPLFMGLLPFGNVLLRLGRTRPAATTAFWITAPPLMAIGSGISMSFTAVQLALNDVSPSPQVLATLNALALTLVSGVRSFTPALFAGLFAVGARTQLLYGYAIWVLMTVLAAGVWVACRWLPDYAQLKSDREQAATTEEVDS